MKALADVLREAYVALAERCDELIENGEMNDWAFANAWKEEVEPRIRKVFESFGSKQ